MKKIIAVGFPGILGILLSLAGVSLITLTDQLLLYIGITLLALAVFFFFKS